MAWTRAQRWLLAAIIILACFCIAAGAQKAAYGRISISDVVETTELAD
jgi:hypothetical protein